MKKSILLFVFVCLLCSTSTMQATNPISVTAYEASAVESQNGSGILSRVKSWTKKTTATLEIRVLALLSLGSGLASMIVWGFVILGFGFDGVGIIIVALGLTAILAGSYVRRRTKEKTEDQRKPRRNAVWGFVSGLGSLLFLGLGLLIWVTSR